jgi:hypothetical protein
VTISRDEDWVQITQSDEAERIVFTQEFQFLTVDLGWKESNFQLKEPHHWPR